MNIEKAKLNSSPYIGIFSIVTENIALVPASASREDVKAFEKTLGVTAIKTLLASSPLLGVFGVGNSRGLVVSGLVERHEIQGLEKRGLNVLKTKSISAIGNLMEVNDRHGVCSSLIGEEDCEKIENMLGVSLKKQRIAGSDLVGSCLVATNNGFMVNPNISEQEFKELEKHFKLKGTASTANYGDALVGNSLVANSRGVVAGALTSGYEIVRIDNGFRGE